MEYAKEAWQMQQLAKRLPNKGFAAAENRYVRLAIDELRRGYAGMMDSAAIEGLKGPEDIVRFVSTKMRL
jgi:hypothetical protein